ncbi:FAD:protein FMN transferase [Candidatus Woesearchaeota archaeon]|nr:FAD:protein FMN transferase [Candidatus Woesearchaeota archaeon]MCF7901556.1 FAD:protein FMN transferase [Candidatus Woesearchaeota archaeon]MCF8013332.1 FAD:protein FMN transferase [Candidatus Woesearchaeota archaeon]
MLTEISFPMFGKEIVIGFEDVDDGILEFNKEDIVSEALRLQKVFNFYDGDSELSKLNKNRKIRASDDFLFVLNSALKYCELSDGKYDISKGFLFIARKNKVPISNIGCSYNDIVVKENLVTLVNDDVLVDLGSIAKGFIVDSLNKYISDLGFIDFFIDARGDMVFNNYYSEIGIQDSRSKGVVHEFVLESGSVATSGDYLQYFDSFENNHLLNNSFYSSVTVVHDSLMIADVLATVISVSGKDFINDHKDLFENIPIFVLDKFGKIVYDSLNIVEVGN